jgi:hypothetical protein
MHRQIFKVLLVIALALVAGSVVLFRRSSSPPIARDSTTSAPASSGRADYSVIESVSESSGRGRPSTASDPNRPSLAAGDGSPQGRSAWSPDALAGIEEPLRSEALDYARRAMALEKEVDHHYAEAGLFDLLTQIYHDQIVPQAIRGLNSSLLLTESYDGMKRESVERHSAALAARFDEEAARERVRELSLIVFEPLLIQLDRQIGEGRLKIGAEADRRLGLPEGDLAASIPVLREMASRLRSQGGLMTIEEAEAAFSDDPLIRAMFVNELSSALRFDASNYEMVAACLPTDLDERRRELMIVFEELVNRNPSLANLLPSRFSEGLYGSYRSRLRLEMDRLQEMREAYWRDRRAHDPFAGMMRPTPESAVDLASYDSMNSRSR